METMFCLLLASQSSVVRRLKLRTTPLLIRVSRAGSLELNLVESVLFNPLSIPFLSEHIFHATLSNSLGVKNGEELSVLVLLNMITILHDNHG